MLPNWLRVGERVSVVDGAFSGLDGRVEHIDLNEGVAAVALPVFGTVTPVKIEITNLGPLGEEVRQSPPVIRCPLAEYERRDLLTWCPKADATFETDLVPIFTYAQIYRRGAQHRLIVRWHNITWPLENEMRWAVRKVRICAAEWGVFAELIEKCGFWYLPYDDGNRVRSTEKVSHWRLRGWDGEKYHAVHRQDINQVDISACCDFLRQLASRVERHDGLAKI